MIDKSIAIIDDKQKMLFSELTKIINRTAQYYFVNGVQPNNNIAILAYNSIEYVITIFALWKIGAIPVPISTRLKENEVKSIIDSSNCNIIIEDYNFSNYINNIASIKLRTISDGEEYKIAQEIKPNNTAVIVYTSGSSGIPKGVNITNSNLYESYILTKQAFDFSSDDKFLATLPFYHIGGFAIINRALLSGGTLILPKSLKQEDIAESILKYNPTIISLVPTMLKRMIEIGVEPNNKLRHLFLGGGPSSDELIHSAFQNNWPIVKVYGASETTAMVTACWGEDLLNHPASAGKPFRNIIIQIVDEEKKIASKNIVGEIAIDSSTIANGYFNNTEMWKAKTHNSLYLTGDYGYLDSDGRLFVVARRTDLIVSGGENIDPREIEKVLDSHQSITESFVFPIESSEWGQIPVAIIVLKEFLSKADTVDFLKSKIASYKIPKRILFVDKIPKSELGKVSIKAAKALLEN